MIDIKGLSLSFGAHVIFGGVDWRIGDVARVGLVGDNGAGKTTLLRLLVGEAEPDDGVISRSKNQTVGYLPQDLTELGAETSMELAGGGSVLEYLRRRVGLSGAEERLRLAEDEISKTSANSKALPSLLDEHSRAERRFESLGGFEFDLSARKTLRGLGFSDGDDARACAEFSGGWKMRIALSALLLSKPDVLLMDEPTNHLDSESMEWLESWINAHRGAVVAVSHDRRFLDNTIKEIAELERGKLTVYPWNYEHYLIEKELARGRLEKTVAEQKARVADIERFISRFRYKSSKAAQVQSRIRQLEKIDIQEIAGPSKTVHFRIPEAPESGREILSAKNLSKSYGAIQVFSGIDLTIARGERVALVGVNGAGKSTLLRILSQTEESDSGGVKLGHNVKRAFYSQESAQNVNYSHTVWEEARGAPSKLLEADRRTLLGSFLFSGEDIQKSVSVLSGGEKARLALFKLMLQETNFLILDEPTNHLDMKTKDLFQRALLQYGGTLLIVSHDRHFLDALADRVIEIRSGRIYDYQGNYSWFLEKREEILKKEAFENENGNTHKKEAKQSGENLKVKRDAKRALKKELSSTEAAIAKQEARKSEIDAQLCLPETFADSEKARSLAAERTALERTLAQDYSRWEEIAQAIAP
ncbi:ABC transporter ATP-binding protein [Synergistales bacterium]|nr:ABC transporter ATP-binding protein [Synergistales bacterium]